MEIFWLIRTCVLTKGRKISTLHDPFVVRFGSDRGGSTVCHIKLHNNLQCTDDLVYRIQRPESVSHHPDMSGWGTGQLQKFCFFSPILLQLGLHVSLNMEYCLTLPYCWVDLAQVEQVSWFLVNSSNVYPCCCIWDIKLSCILFLLLDKKILKKNMCRYCQLKKIRVAR